MDVLSLDEMQGVTDEMIRAHMEAEGWRLVHGVWELRDADGRWQGGMVDDDRFIDRMFDQEWLRKLNPRMRKGKPSTAALMAHQGNWIVRDDETGSLGVYPSHMMDYSSREDCLSFWPCDEHGNKIPWPERDGVML